MLKELKGTLELEIFYIKNTTLQTNISKPSKTSEMTFKYFSPFEVAQKIGNVAYKLAFLEGSKKSIRYFMSHG